MSTHTLLGANGVIAREISYALANTVTTIRQVSRNPQKVNASDETVSADLLDAKATSDAVKGSEVVYLVAGLQYDTVTWQTQWPRVMSNVINACKEHGARLVFFDNVYSYGQVQGAMTEQTPFNPCSKKGEVRARIASQLLDEMHSGNLQALIARSADFYGPGATQSLLFHVLFERLRQQKTPQWMGNTRAIHTFTYTPDAGRAIALLAQSDKAYGQTWHLPTSDELLNAERFIQIACEISGRPNKVQVAPKWLLKLMGVFFPEVRENHEMMYQLENDYHFNSTKITNAYNLVATPYQLGIAQCVK